jgi:Family of unknown function (DUF5995)
MTTWPTSIQALTQRVALTPANRTVGEVVDRLTGIETTLDGFFAPPGDPGARRARQPLPDGVACFNGMYLEVTKAVRDALPTFESPEFIERLDVVFAQFYFEAYDAAGADAWVSKAWEPLFKRRAEHRLPLQFAIAGMNAHINNDLAHALVLTWQERGVPAQDSPERRDYEKVNAILENVEGELKAPLSDALIAEIDTAFGTTDDFLAMWSISAARDQAWERARIMQHVTGNELGGLFDRLVGFAGNLLLGPAL